MIEIKNKFTVDPHAKGEQCSYQFNFTPTSIHSLQHGRLERRIKFKKSISENQKFLFSKFPLIEYKFRKCVFFEDWIRCSLNQYSGYINTRAMIYIMNKIYNESQTYMAYTFNNKLYKFANSHYLDSDQLHTYHIPSILKDGYLPIIGFTPKYALVDDDYETDASLDVIIRSTFDVIPTLPNDMDKVRRHLFNTFGIDRKLALIYVAMKQAALDTDYAAFKQLFLSLIDNNEPLSIDDLNDNVVLKGFEDNDIHSSLPRTSNLFESLNNTVGKVVLTPAKKSYMKHVDNELPRNSQNFKRRIVDQYKIFFETENDARLFFEKYTHYSSLNLLSGLACNRNYLNDTDKVYVHYYQEKDANIIQNKIKNTSLDVEISKRKTPFYKDCYGYAILNSITLDNPSSILDDNDRENITQYIEKVSGKLKQFGINELLFATSPVYTSAYKEVLYEKGNIRAYTPFFISMIDKTKLVSDITILFDKMDRLHNNSYSSFGISRSPIPRITMAVPIIRNDEGYSHITSLLKRQKLTGNLGGFKITSLIFAPYATTVQDEVDTLLEAINDI